MKTRELFEMASLDILGLLDEQERAAFEDAFRAAPPHIQAQVRREQVRFSDMERMLPDVEAPLTLRAKVAAAVREAIAAVRTEPVARIGHGTVRVGFNSAPIWRAACIGFATASMVLAGFGYKIIQDNRAIADMALSDRNLSQLAKITGNQEFSTMLTHPRVQSVSFAPAAKDVEVGPEAKLYINPETKTAYLFMRRLPVVDTGYTLIIASPDDPASIREIKKFEAHPGVFSITVPGIEPQDVKKLQIVGPKDGTGNGPVVLSTSDV